MEHHHYYGPVTIINYNGQASEQKALATKKTFWALFKEFLGHDKLWIKLLKALVTFLLSLIGINAI